MNRNRHQLEVMRMRVWSWLSSKLGWAVKPNHERCWKDVELRGLSPVYVLVSNASETVRWTSKASTLRTLITGLLCGATLFVSSLSYAKDEYREPVWTWKLYGGNSGDYDSPEGPINAWNQDQEERYNSCMALNCGGGSVFNPNYCAKLKYTGLVPWSAGNIFNGVAARQMTTVGELTDAAPVCTTSSGEVVYEGRSPTTTISNGSIAVFASLHCPENRLPANFNGRFVTINGETFSAYDAFCVRSVPDPPSCEMEKTGVSSSCGNPVDALIGAKIESVTDYSANDGLLKVGRSYSSQLGKWNWWQAQTLDDFTGLSSASGNLLVSEIPLYPAVLNVLNPATERQPTALTFPLVKDPTETRPQVWFTGGDGRRTMFTQDSSGSFSTKAIRKPSLKLLTDANGASLWSVNDAGELKLFNTTGLLLRRVMPDGKSVEYSYGMSSITLTSWPGGRQLVFSKSFPSAKGFDVVTLPDGSVIQYQINQRRLVTGVNYPDGTSKGYLYDEAAYSGADSSGNVSTPNRLTGQMDESGVRYGTYKYDSSGPISTENAGGVNKYTFYFYPSSISGSNRVTAPPLSAQTTFNWEQGPDGERRPTSVWLPAGAGSAASSRSLTYAADGTLASNLDPKGTRTCYSYDSARRLETIRLEGLTIACPATPASYSIPANTSQRKITTEWRPDWELSARVAEPKRITTYVYNGQPDATVGGAIAVCAPTSAVLPDGKPIAVLCKKQVQDTADATGSAGFSATLTAQAPRVWTYTYDNYGRVLTADGPRTDVSDLTTYTYYNCDTGYQCGQLQTVTDTLGHVTTYNAYNAHGQPLTITDPNGVVTTLTYDLRQRLTSRTVGGEATAFAYWPTGLLKQVTLPDGSYLAYTYDAAHRLTQINDAVGNGITYTLDAAGNRTAEQVFDATGYLARSSTRTYDALSRLYQQLAAAATAAQTTTFGYDANGNQTTVNAPLARNTTNQYDELNRLKQVTDPGSGTTKYGYDANDNLVSVTDPRNLTTTYAYTGLGDLTQLSSPDTGATLHTYDTAGNLATRTDARNAVATYAYDALNRLTQVAYSDQTQGFQYDQGANGIGRLTALTDASGSTSLAYTAQGRLASKTQIVSGISKTLSYGYNSAGQLTTLTTPSGQVVTYSYTHGQVTSMAVNGSPLLTSVLYDPFGPTQGWTWGNGTLTARQYDQDGQLTTLDSAGLSTYTYHPDGTIASRSDDSSANLSLPTGVTNLSVSTTSNRIDGSTGTLARTYSYDATGNTLSDGLRTFTYNGAGRMVTATNGGITTTYSYNALGQRVKKSNSNGTTYFIYDEQGHLLGEYDQSGNMIQELVWLNEIPVATIRTDQGGTGAGVFYIHTDHLNAPTKVTRPSDNQVIWRWDHDPYGNGTPNQDPDGNGLQLTMNLRFPGQYYDSETGLHYNYFRDYDPAIGRYVASDPIGLSGEQFSTYTYTDGNPINAIDPLGLQRASARGGYQYRETEYRRPDNFSEAAGYFGDGLNERVCAEWNCPQSTTMCKATDWKKPNDFIPASSNLGDKPGGCTCASYRWKPKQHNDPLEPDDILEAAVKTDDIHRNGPSFWQRLMNGIKKGVIR